MQIKIPELKSRYIPVHGGFGNLEKGMHWWEEKAAYIYPNVLFNLLHFTKEQVEFVRKNAINEMFILTDSGGFQVVSGTCDLDWKGSLLKQIELTASKIFSLDKPTVKQKASAGSLTNFVYMNDIEAEETIIDNFEVALKQSEFLKQNYPEEFKKFCYILQGKSLEQINFNMKLFNDKLGGVDKYSDYFPGGVVYAAKGGDNMYITMAARHAYENFIKKGIYVHFLGMGSFHRMIILIRNEITTFDSSTLLQGVRVNEFLNPVNLNDSFCLSSDDLNGFVKPFCNCPVCRNVDYFKIQKESPSDIGRNCVLHNLWHLLIMNTILDALPKDKYTEKVTTMFNLNEGLHKCLEFCDECDKIGFDLSYEKYKHYLKKDVTKQNTLF